MTHTLYTTYISKLKSANIPEDAVKILIMRMPPLSVKQIDGLIHVPELSPKSDILLNYKRNNDWEKFTNDFNEQIDTDPELKKYLDYIVEALDYNDIYLVCCEKNKDNCHRTILANKIKQITGCNIVEI